jgi:hypothetical protein
VYAAASTPAAGGAGSVLSGTAALAGSRRSVAAAATGAGPAGGPGSAEQPPAQLNFSGLWVKVPERSDQGERPAARHVGLRWLHRLCGTSGHCCLSAFHETRCREHACGQIHGVAHYLRLEQEHRALILCCAAASAVLCCHAQLVTRLP